MRTVLAAAIVWLFLLGVAWGEEPVSFADAALKAAVEEKLWLSDPTATDMLNLTSLDAGDREIKSLVGLEYAKNLTDLRLRFNRIQDISPLASLTNLRYLVLHRNWLTDLSPLAGLHNLYHLDLNDTHSKDISALAPLTQLSELILYNNGVTDISILTNFKSLTYRDLRMNPLSDGIYDVVIPQIRANNPLITIEHDRGPYSLTITSTVGGSVIDPGEGTFVYNDGSTVYIEAKADPGFVFAGFTGTLTTKENPAILQMGWDYTVQALFESVLDTLYVDDDAPGDVGKNNADVGDPYENGTAEHPYDRIQEAVDVARGGGAVIVRPGTYLENVRIVGKSLTLTGSDPNDPAGTAWPVISAAKGNSVLFVSGVANSHCVVSGFVITGCKGQAGAISCSNATATVSHCLIGGNRPNGSEAALLYCSNSDVLFTHCTMVNNHMTACNGGLRAVGSKVAITNSIFCSNTFTCFNSSIKRFSVDAGSELTVSYSDIADGWPGVGNIDTDPLFVSPGRWTHSQSPGVSPDPTDPYAVWAAGDYHLKSMAGRWDSQARQWIADDQTSPCIDGGDPLDSIDREPAPNGGIVDMGVYGGTTEASLSH